MSIERISQALVARVECLDFDSPVTHVYNPLDYAWSSHRQFLRRFGTPPKTFLLVGMNPGPFGMAQTGVPFGEVAAVRDWLGVEAEVNQPAVEHPKRPVQGFACSRSEVSGRRFWGWAAARFATPEEFFARWWVHNYCPLVFMEESGRNLTPDKLPVSERKPLFDACDQALRDVVEYMEVTTVIGIGVFAEKRARQTLADMDLRFGRIPHPSPASPLANRGWTDAAEKALAAMGVSP